MKSLALIVALLFVGCAAKLGPGEEGWAKWDLCGFEGGVASELTILGTNTWRLGCTSPEPPAEEPPHPAEGEAP